MLACLICLLPLQAQPVVELPSGRPIVFDGRLEAGEWADALSFGRKLGGEHRLRFVLKRNGAWLAVGLSADREYAGEVLRLFTADQAGSWVCSLFAGLGHPSMPPGLWRRGPATAMTQAGRPECPRGVRARLVVGGPDSWSAEYLVRLASLGIGHRDLRTFRFHAQVSTPGPEGTNYVRIPEAVKDPADVGNYAILKGDWGSSESWPPVPPEISREFDDHELLYRLFLEHDKFALRLTPDQLVISSAVRPRSETRIAALRAQLDEGRKRNPTLPAWDYFLGRLLHEGNHFEEARGIVKAIPPALARLGPFVNLSAEHYIDTHEPQKALDICKDRKDVLGIRETVVLALNVRRALAEEAKAEEHDATKPDRNPRIRIVTAKGAVVCELFEDDAPLAVRNFMNLVLKHKFYDGLTFHTVAGGALVQTGDPRTRPGATVQRDNPGWRLKADQPKRNPLRGRLAVVPQEGSVLHGSQFIIGVTPMVQERRLVVFGRVLDGMDVVDKLEQDDRLVRVEVIYKRNHVYDPLDSRIR